MRKSALVPRRPATAKGAVALAALPPAQSAGFLAADLLDLDDLGAEIRQDMPPRRPAAWYSANSRIPHAVEGFRPSRLQSGNRPVGVNKPPGLGTLRIAPRKREEGEKTM